MRWLIVEDALRDHKGHWFEYLGTFARELRALGDNVTILSDRSAESFLVEQLQAQSVLPASIWHRMGDGAGPVRRYLRVPVHAWQTYRTIKKYLRGGTSIERHQLGKIEMNGSPGESVRSGRGAEVDVIFVPTVLWCITCWAGLG